MTKSRVTINNRVSIHASHVGGDKVMVIRGKSLRFQSTPPT